MGTNGFDCYPLFVVRKDVFVEEILRARTDSSLYNKNYKKEVGDLLKRLDKLAKNGRVSRTTAVKFVEKSA